MPASLSLPPRHSREHFEALASDKLPVADRLAIISLLALASWALVGFCATLAGVI